jgi:hypothetical protein
VQKLFLVGGGESALMVMLNVSFWFREINIEEM